MNAGENMIGSGNARSADQPCAYKGDQESTTTINTSRTELLTENATMREKLRVISELSKYVWFDNQKRNYELLNKIHSYVVMEEQ